VVIPGGSKKTSPVCELIVTKLLMHQQYPLTNIFLKSVTISVQNINSVASIVFVWENIENNGAKSQQSEFDGSCVFLTWG
jgi:hypothetical protein